MAFYVCMSYILCLKIKLVAYICMYPYHTRKRTEDFTITPKSKRLVYINTKLFNNVTLGLDSN